MVNTWCGYYDKNEGKLTCYYSENLYFQKTPPLNGGNTYPSRLFPLNFFVCWTKKKKNLLPTISFKLSSKKFGPQKNKKTTKKFNNPKLNFFGNPSKKNLEERKKKLSVRLSALVERFSMSRMRNF